MRRHRLAWLVGLAIVVLQRSAHADPAPRVALSSSADDRIGARLRAELGALGFDVIRVDEPTAAPTRTSLEQSARDAGAAAAVRVVPSNGGVEIWIADRVTGKIVLREIPVSADSAVAEVTLALRAVELLRASLMEVDAPHPSRGEVPPSAEVREVAQRSTPLRGGAANPRAAIIARAPARAESREREEDVAARSAPASAVPARLTLELGGGVVASPGGLGPMGGVVIGVNWLPGRWVGATVLSHVPLVPTRVEDARFGEASIRAGLVGAGVRLAFAPPSAAWTPSLVAGVAGAWLRMEGAARAPYRASSADVVVPLPFLRVGVARRLREMTRVRADALVGVAIPAPTVEFTDVEVARWGQPVLLCTLALEQGVL